MSDVSQANWEGLDEVHQYIEVPPTPCARLIGCAGSGKSYTLMARIKASPAYGMLCATTGISAINIGATTLNSALGYFDTKSMRDALLTGRLVRKLHAIAKSYRWLVVEEYSMLDADQLDILKHAVDQANKYQDVPEPMGILLVGDLAQLPPVRARWCFEAECWTQFSDHTERLTKVWRQNGGLFLDALNHVRSGDGRSGADTLVSAGARFHTMVDTQFAGTTILPKNDMVNNYNWDVLRRIPGAPFSVSSRRWGSQRSEWGMNARTKEWGIPLRVDLKVGAYVMILANQLDANIVNGDCGYVVGHVPSDPGSPHSRERIVVKLIRTGTEIDVYPIVRGVESSDKPVDWSDREMRVVPSLDNGEWIPRRHYRGQARRYVLGQVEFWPLRLAYASTVHKSQSLSLDNVQVDFRDNFFSANAMMYVALSRARTLEGLRLIGDADRFVKNCTVDKRILPWL